MWLLTVENLRPRTHECIFTAVMVLWRWGAWALAHNGDAI
jgi:hypothetical protein